VDPIRNPYSPGAGFRPPSLVGRDQELASFSVTLARLEAGRPAKSLLLTGLRGVGKTVMLSEFARLANERSWSHESVEANDSIDLPVAIANVVRKATLRLSRTKRAAERAKRTFGVLRSFQIRWKLPGDITIETEPLAGLGDSGDLETDLGDLLVELGELAKEHGTGVLFTIDELQYLTRPHLAALVTALHRVAQQGLPVLVAGAGLPSLLGLIGEAKSYAERLFQFTEIGSLSRDECHRALQEPAQSEGVSWEVPALERIFEVSGGYPYFLQEFGKQSWEFAIGLDDITLEDVTTAVPEAISELDAGFFRVRFDRVNDSERNYLRAMASLGQGPYNSGAVAAKLNKKTAQVGPHRDALIRRGLIYSRRYGEIDFTVPMFDEYIRRSFLPSSNA
jgi:AAA ATPase domain